MRIKKKFLLFVFILVCFVFIFLYLNQLVPRDIPESFNQSGLKRDRSFIAKSEQPIFKKPRHHFKNPNDDDINNQIEADFDSNDDLPSKDLINEGIIQKKQEDDSDQSCNIDVDVVPNANVQMLDAYREIPFDNVDGGAWKQGEFSFKDPEGYGEIISDYYQAGISSMIFISGIENTN